MQNQNIDAIWHNANLATFSENRKKPYGAIQNGAIATKDGKIIWVGEERELQEQKFIAKNTYDLEGRWITPGFTDCHTHLVYAGNRANEFEKRLQGYTYGEIAAAGGGILSTVNATRNANEESLFMQSARRLQCLISEGVTTVEIKSGYGLDRETEIKCLRVAKKLAQHFPVTVKTTYLGAHAIPPEYKQHPDDYIEYICKEVLPFIHSEKLADAVDGFCEKIAFNPLQITRFFDAATKLGLPVKLHAEQLSDSKGALLAANFHALSCDHLEYISEESLQAMAKQGSVAVLLPGAYYFLNEKVKPPIAKFREYQIPMAIATDANPGTSPILSILLIANMACTLFGFTPEEALRGICYNSAKALGLEKTHGSLEKDKVADFAIWDINSPVELVYAIGQKSLYHVVKNGVLV